MWPAKHPRTHCADAKELRTHCAACDKKSLPTPALDGMSGSWERILAVSVLGCSLHIVLTRCIIHALDINSN